MTRAKDPKQDDIRQGDVADDRNFGVVAERARVQQARESVQDAIGKIIGEPLGERPDDDAATAEADADADRDGKDDARKPVSPPVKRGNRIDENGAD